LTASIRALTRLAAADDRGAAVEAALLRPAPHHEKQHTAEGEQRDEPDDVEAAEPDAGEFLAGFGEERPADHQQEHHRPGGGETEILFLMAAKRLHLVDVGHLKRQHGQHGHGGDRAEIVPGHAFHRHHVSGVDRGAGQRHQRQLDHADRAGEHDRRHGWRNRLGCGLLGGRSEAVRAGRPRCRAERRRCGFNHAAGVELGHGRTSLRAPTGARSVRGQSS
jgi:hypothetical protein